MCTEPGYLHGKEIHNMLNVSALIRFPSVSNKLNWLLVLFNFTYFLDLRTGSDCVCVCACVSYWTVSTTKLEVGPGDLGMISSRRPSDMCTWSRATSVHWIRLECHWYLQLHKHENRAAATGKACLETDKNGTRFIFQGDGWIMFWVMGDVLRGPRTVVEQYLLGIC